MLSCTLTEGTEKGVARKDSQLTEERSFHFILNLQGDNTVTSMHSQTQHNAGNRDHRKPTRTVAVKRRTEVTLFGPFHHRNEHWASKKQEKILTEKNAQFAQEIKECTFQPELQGKRHSSVLNQSMRTTQKRGATYCQLAKHREEYRRTSHLRCISTIVPGTTKGSRHNKRVSTDSSPFEYEQALSLVPQHLVFNYKDITSKCS